MSKKSFDPFDHPKKRGFPPFYFVENIVLFFDIVGFTQKPTNEEMQRDVQHIDNVIDRILFDDFNWNEPKSHNDLIMIPTGDGYAIGFHPNITGEKVLTIARDLFKALVEPKYFQIRMGIAKGSNVRFKDKNDVTNLFGYGINLANRVMGVGKSNQILVHEELALSIGKKRTIPELVAVPSDLEIKHGGKIRVFNYYRENEFGNPEMPD
jgi:hypothetical protein